MIPLHFVITDSLFHPTMLDFFYPIFLVFPLVLGEHILTWLPGKDAHRELMFNYAVVSDASLVVHESLVSSL